MEASDAENVVEKNDHSLNKYEFSKTLVWQKDAMIVSNVHKDTSQENLIEFLEMNAKLVIVYISPGSKSGTFLVYCQNEIDFEYVQKTCLENCLMGNYLKVDKSKEIHSILVKANTPKASSDNIKVYFKNKNISSGGDISSIQELPNNTYIVSFQEKSVVLDVCSRKHLLQREGEMLDVQPFWEPLEEKTISRLQVYEFVLSSEFQLDFFKQNKNLVNSQLKELAEVIWEDCRCNKLKLQYTEGNFEKIDECLKDILHSITVEVIDIPANIFTDTVESFKNSPDPKYIYFDHQNCQANIIGFNKNNVDEKKKKLLNLKIKCEEELSIHERHILSGLNLFSWLEREFEDLKMTVYGNKLSYEGHSSQVSKCRMKVSEIVKPIVKSELCLPLHAGMIINKEAVKKYLMEKLRNNNCVGSWEVLNGDSVLIYASGEKHLSILEKIMKQTFVANKLDFIQKIEGTSNYEKWLTFLENLKELQDLYFIGKHSLSFIAVDSVANDIKKEIDNFIQSLTYESCISMSHEHFLFLKRFKEEDITEFCKKSKIEMLLEENKLHFEGTEDQIKEVEIFIENLRKDINSHEEIFELLGFREFVNSEEGSSFLNEMQIKTESIIIYSVIESETDEILKFLYKKCTIALIEGDITTLNTDAIVNAANSRLEHFGGIAAAIVQKGGYEIQVESDNIISKSLTELKTGDVVSTHPGKLKCKTIIHAVGPRWSNGHNQELFYLSKVVTNCLSFLDKHSYTSIAIPAISTGIFGIPIEEGTKCILESIKSYLDNNSSSNIKYICLIDIRKPVIRHFKFHLESMLKNSQSDNEDIEVEDNVTVDHKYNGVVLKFFSNHNNLVKVVETIKKEYNSMLTTEEIPLEIDLKEAQKQKIKKCIGKDEIQINIRDSIKIHGRPSPVKDAKIAIETLLIEFKNENKGIFMKIMQFVCHIYSFIKRTIFQILFPRN